MSEAKAEDSETKDIFERSSRLRLAVTRSGGATAVSKGSGIPATTIQNYMGGRDLKVGALIALAAACNVSLEWLATGDGPMEGREEVGRSCVSAFGDSLEEPANFMGFCILLITCQEWHTQMKIKPTLAEVFEWIGPNYPRSLSFPDGPIRLKPDEANP